MQFYRAVNLLHRKSAFGQQPSWVADWLNRGKPERLLELQQNSLFKNALPRVIRPDILLTEEGFSITELDSVPGGIGLTGWLNKTYTEAGFDVIGGKTGMLDGFSKIFPPSGDRHIVIAEESATYRPEMKWIAEQLPASNFQIRSSDFNGYNEGDSVYRFFELFDLPNIPCAEKIFQLAAEKKIFLTPPPKPVFEEKLLFGLLWNRNLKGFWNQELGTKFFEKLQQHIPYTWIIDPLHSHLKEHFPE